MTVLYLSFGAESYHAQAAYSLLSLRRSGYTGTVEVHTDNPDWFRDPRIASKTGPLNLQAMSAEDLKRHCANGYFFRYKLVVLKAVLARSDWVLFLDTDTVIAAPLKAQIEALARGETLLFHEREGRIDEAMPSLQALVARNASRWHRPIRPNEALFNSGVVGLHKNDAAVLDRALALCDDMHDAQSEVHTFEQLALSAAALDSGRPIATCFDEVNHYWHAKKQFTRALLAGIHDEPMAEPTPPERLSAQTLQLVASYIRRHHRWVREWLRLQLRLGLLSKREMAAREQRRQAAKA